MPAVNPRLSITVTPRVDAVLTRFAQVTGQSKSSTVGGILDESFEMLSKMVKIMEAAKSAQDNMAKTVVKPFHDAHAHVEEQLGLALADINSVADDLLATVEKVERRTRRASARDVSEHGASAPRAALVAGSKSRRPPLSNRGGKPTTGKHAQRTKPLKIKAKGRK